MKPLSTRLGRCQKGRWNAATLLLLLPCLALTALPGPAAANPPVPAAGHVGQRPAQPARPAEPTPAELSERLARMPVGDPTRGAKLYEQQFCASCHGQAGQAPTLNWPHTAGQRAAYSYKLLQDYQNGLRNEGERAALMRDAVQDLSAQALADLAAHMARQPRAKAALRPPAPSEAAAQALRLVRDGDPKRLMTACASCHGARGEGSLKAQPALAGQNPAYLVRTLLDYHGGLRANDPAQGMRLFARRLSRQEIDALAQYYATLGAPR